METTLPKHLYRYVASCLVAPSTCLLGSIHAYAQSMLPQPISVCVHTMTRITITQPQASEIITQIAFYAGWPNAFSALPVVKDVLEKRKL